MPSRAQWIARGLARRLSGCCQGSLAACRRKPDSRHPLAPGVGGRVMQHVDEGFLKRQRCLLDPRFGLRLIQQDREAPAAIDQGVPRSRHWSEKVTRSGSTPRDCGLAIGFVPLPVDLTSLENECGGADSPGDVIRAEDVASHGDLMHASISKTRRMRRRPGRSAERSSGDRPDPFRPDGQLLGLERVSHARRGIARARRVRDRRPEPRPTEQQEAQRSSFDSVPATHDSTGKSRRAGELHGER